jgi:hypothetical protein
VLYVLVPLGLLGLGIARLFTGGHLAGHLEHFLLVAAIVLVFSIAQGYAVAVSYKRVIPRPRWHYLLFCLGYLLLVLVSSGIGGWADSDHLGWLSQAMVWPAGLASGGALVMFGRCVFRGRLRRAFWRIPPPWLDEDPGRRPR